MRGEWDAIVIGGGHGGTLAADELRRGGWQVLMLERERGQTVTQLEQDGLRVTAVEATDGRNGPPDRFHADTVVLAAGALASRQLILASGLEQLNPAGVLVATLRMGADVRTSVLDPTGRFRGLENLYVVDAANAVRVGAQIVDLRSAAR